MIPILEQSTWNGLTILREVHQFIISCAEYLLTGFPVLSSPTHLKPFNLVVLEARSSDQVLAMLINFEVTAEQWEPHIQELSVHLHYAQRSSVTKET